MYYSIFHFIENAATFEEACTLAELGTEPVFEETLGEALYHAERGVILLPVTDDDELTDAEAQDLAEDSLTLAEMFLNEMDGADPFPRHDPPGIG